MNKTFKPIYVKNQDNAIFQKHYFPKTDLIFTCLHCKSFENNAGKGEIARHEQFLLFPQCFLPVGELSAIFI